MAAEESRQRSYTPEDKAGALFALDLNQGYVKPTASQVQVPRPTLDRWSKSEVEPATAAALTAIREHKKVSELAERFLELAKAGADHALANLDKASPYHGALIGAIALDKWALITGRPTSRTEVLRARYVEPGDLRRMSGAVIEVEAQSRRGASSGAGPSHVPAKEKRPTRSRSPRSRKGSVGEGVNDLPVSKPTTSSGSE